MLLESVLTSGAVNGTPDNIEFISSKGDFPAPVSGVITLAANTMYWITTTVDLEGDRIVAAPNTVIRGSSLENSVLKSTGLTGTALITSAYSLPVLDMQFTADIAFDVDATGNAGQSLNWISVNFIDCGAVGTFTNLINFIAIDMVVESSGGLTFDGTTGSVVISESLLQGNGEGVSMFTIPSTATITRRIRLSDVAIVVPTGDTGTNVSTSATVPVEGFILNAVNFSGGGTFNAGVQYDDNKSWFRFCRGVRNSNQIGQYSMTGNATATVISTINTPVKAAGTTTAATINQKFTHTNNRLTFSGAITRDFKVTATFSASAGNNNQLGFYVAKNGTIVSETQSVVTANSGGRLENGYVQGILELEQGDYIEIWCENKSGTGDITVEDLNVIIRSEN